MDDKQVTGYSDRRDAIDATYVAEEEDLYTQSVDLTQWFSTGLTATGSFDLGIVAATQFGNLLDALPIPTLMLDGSYTVVFANQACGKISPNYQRIQGVPFTTLVPRSRNAEKAQWLVRKVFATRKPQVADGILELEAKKIWGRLHFSAIRIGRERYVLLLIEDLTGEKTQLLLNRRDDSQIRKERQGLEKLVAKLTAELGEARFKLAGEVNSHSETRKVLKSEQEKHHALAAIGKGPVAIVNRGMGVQYVNGRFRELFGFPDEQIPLLSDWWTRMSLPDAECGRPVADQLDALAQRQETTQEPFSVTFRNANGSEELFALTVIKLHDDEYMLFLKQQTSEG